MIADASRDLLFGLFALQNALIDQVQLVAAFQAWARIKGRALADHLVDRGDLDADQRGVLEAMVGLHVKKHGGNVEKSLASIPTDHSTRERLAALADPELTRTVGHLGSDSTVPDTDRTASHAAGTDTGDGQRYRILRPHARGGLGAVFVALDNDLHREVAIKQLLDHHAADPVSRQRFLVEAQITGGLEHPGIVPVYGLGKYDDGRPYYAMRFIKGESLKEAIAHFHADEALKSSPGRRSLELRSLLRRFTDVCNAIDYAHSRGVIHRDIKPGNIIVGKYGETLVVDWGLAKALGRVESASDTGEQTLVPSSDSGTAETLPGSALGTPAFMSPEQARGEMDRLGPRSDVCALGATLYCLLTGKPPFEDAEIGELLRKVQRGEFAPPRRIDPSIDRALEAICLKAMTLNPDDRYETARALADDIDRWMADEPVTAWREPVVRRTRRWARRHRTVVAGAVSTLFMALVGTGSVLAVQTAANRELQTANTKLFNANGQTTKANNDLIAANERERERFELAMEAIKTFHSGVSDDVLLKKKEFGELRTKLLLGAKNFYSRLESLLANQSDRRSRRALGRAYGELASLTEQIGSQDEALAAFGRVLTIRRGLAADSEPGSSDLDDVASTLGHIARLQFRTGQSAVALATMEEEREVRQRLVQQSPNDWVALKALANNLNSIGIVQHNIGRLGDARLSYQQALAMREQLCKARPDDLELRQGLARNLNSLCVYYHDIGSLEESIAFSRRVLEIRQAIARAKPDDAPSQIDLGIACNNMGALSFEIGRTEEARQVYYRARGIYVKVLNANPNVSTYHEFLGDNCRNLANALLKLGRFEEAGEAAEQSLDAYGILARDNPTVPRFQIGLARVGYLQGKQLALAGHRAEGIAAMEQGQSRVEAVLKANPELLEAKVELSMLATALAHLFRDTGQADEARQAYAKARDTVEDLIKTRPGSASDQFELARVLIEIAKLEPERGAWNSVIATLQTAISLVEKKPDGPSSLYERARGHALLSAVFARTESARTPAEARAQADVSMALLRQAVQSGYQDLVAMRSDDDLGSLKTRTDFQTLLMDLALPAEPFAP
jgi:serine/threonine-protein kinase